MADSPDPFRPRLRVHRLTWLGLAGAVLGTGPLVAVIVAAGLGWTDDPNPNPVGFGMLAACTLVPSLVLAAVGAVISLVEFARDRPGPG